MYFTDRGIEELEDRRGEEQVSVTWLAERLRVFVDLNPGFEVAVDRLASWLARLDDDEDLFSRTIRVHAPATRLAARRLACLPLAGLPLADPPLAGPPLVGWPTGRRPGTSRDTS